MKTFLLFVFGALRQILTAVPTQNVERLGIPISGYKNDERDKEYILATRKSKNAFSATSLYTVKLKTIESSMKRSLVRLVRFSLESKNYDSVFNNLKD